jgi:hypothetical protein
MDACRGVCEGYKQMYHHMPTVFSALSLQTVFIAGLTLIYCLWYKNSTAIAMKDVNALNDCSIMLYIITERWTASSKYRDAFEGIKRSVMDMLSEGRINQHRAVAGVGADVRDTLQNLDAGMAESNRDAYQQMVESMTGEQLDFDNPADAASYDVGPPGWELGWHGDFQTDVI